MNTFHWLALAAGMLLPLQVAFNNRLAALSGSPSTSSLISFSVGTVMLLIYSALNFDTLQQSWQPLRQAPWYAWTGGAIGACYIIATVVATPKIGIAVFLVTVIGGQLFTSALLEHHGWLGTPVRHFDLTKALGLVLVLIGIFLIKK